MRCLLRHACHVKDPSVLDGHWTLIEKLRTDERITATAMQTVGLKRWDGITLAVVRSADQ